MKFCDEAHERFFYECTDQTEMASSDPFRMALFYTLGLTEETRRYVHDLYDFNKHGLLIEGLNKPWQTNTTMKVTRLAFNLFNGYVGDDERDARLTSPYEIFCNGLAEYFFEAIKILYREYCNFCE